MNNVTKSEITQAHIHATHTADAENGAGMLFVLIAICWLPALFVGPIEWVKTTWKVGAPVTAFAVVGTAAVVDNRKKIWEQAGREKVQAQGLREF